MLRKKIQVLKDMLGSLHFVLRFAPAYNPKKTFYLCGLLFFSGLFELLSLYSIFPFIAIASKPEIILTHPLLSSIYATLPVQTTAGFISLVGVGIVLAIFAGNAIAAYTVVQVSKFCFDCGHEVSLALFKKQLQQDYESFVHQSTSDMAKDTLDEINRFATGFLIPVLYGAVKLTTTVFILSMLMIVNFKIAMMLALVFGTTYTLFYSKVKSKLAGWGADRARLNAERYQVVGESLRGYKEIQMSQKVDHFINQYAHISEAFNYTEVKNVVTPSLARYILEATSIAGMIVVGLYLVHTSGNLAESMPLLAVYALSGLRLMPAVQQLFSSLTLAKFHYASLVSLEKALKDDRPEMDETSSQDEQAEPHQKIMLRNVTYQYPKTDRLVISDISLDIPVKSCLGIMGKTGSGKSTLADILMGFLPVKSGQILIDDKPISFKGLQSLRGIIGYVPQKLFLLDASIAENIAFAEPKSNIDYAWVKQCAKMARIDSFVDGLSDGYNTQVGENGVRLSGGQLQRIAIARALYKKPQIIIFDEATSALDTETEAHIMEALQSLYGKVTMILIAHRLSTLEKCDQVLLLDNGKPQAMGTLTEVLASPVYQQLIDGKKEASLLP